MTTRTDYIQELEKLTTALESYELLYGEHVPIEYVSEKVLEEWEALVNRAVFVSDVLDGIDFHLKQMRDEQTAHNWQETAGPNPSAVKSNQDQAVTTLELMQRVACHLSGRDVKLSIGLLGEKWDLTRPLGQCWREGEAVKIQIDPQSVNQSDYLFTVLHEIAHAKNDMSDAAWKASLDGTDDKAGKEQAADMQARRWENFARTHRNLYLDAGGRNPASNDFRSCLFALLYSRITPGL